jgi:hypothetical protein
MATPTRVLRPTQTARKRPRVAGWNTTTAGVRPRSQWAFLTGDDYPASPWPATEADAMGLPPFGRGVALLANAVAGTGWHAARWDPEVGVSVRLTDQPSVVTDPDPETTPWNYRWAATEDLILYGNHFAIPGDLDYRTLRPGWLTPVPADAVWILQDPTDPSWFRWVIGGTELAAMDLFHVSAGNRSGEVLGRGCLSQYGKWLGGAVAAEEHSGDYFAGGALPPAVLQSPMVLTESQATDLKAKWRDMVSTREPVVLPADIEFVRDSVDRYGKPLSEAFTKWLTPRGTSVEWDYAGRMRADQSTTAKVLTTYTAAGILTKDEARAAIGRPPLPEPEAVPAPPTPPELGPDQVVESAADQPPVEGVTTDAGTTD